MQCLLFILRKTYGWKKKEDQISLTQFQEATNLKRSHVCRALKNLSDKKIISTKKGTSKATTYRFNKRYSSWLSSPKKGTTTKSSPKKGTIGSPNIGNRVVPKKGHTIDTITKDTITKDNKNVRTQKTFEPESIPYLLSEILLDQITINLPEFKPSQNGNKESTLQRWALDIDRMIRLDNRKPCPIWNMIIWCQQDDFWFKNILSGSKLRKQYDKLAMAINAEYRKNKTTHIKTLEAAHKWLTKKSS